MPKLKLYKTSVSTDTDRHLCEFLCSTYTNFGTYKRRKHLNIPEDNLRVQQRLKFLKTVKKSARVDFDDHCRGYGLIPATNIIIPSDHSTSNPEMTIADKENSTIPHADENEFGKVITVQFPNDVLYCVVYPPFKFDGSLQLSIAQDGRSIEKKVLKRIPKDASEIVDPTEHPPGSFEYCLVDAKIHQMKQKLQEWEKIDDEPLLLFGEEMAPYFVDSFGRYHDSYLVDTVEQYVSFYVRTMKSTKEFRLPRVMNAPQARRKPAPGLPPSPQVHFAGTSSNSTCSTASSSHPGNDTDMDEDFVD